MSAALDRMFEQGTYMAKSGMAFVDDNVLQQIPYMRENELDGLDFGAVQVDEDGVVKAYNRYESQITGTPVDKAMGANFFNEIAPCTNNSLFQGVFKKGVTSGSMNTLFPYTFTYRMKPTNVLIHLYRCPRTQSNWILVKKR
jgi:photoactive yellow protein